MITMMTMMTWHGGDDLDDDVDDGQVTTSKQGGSGRRSWVGWKGSNRSDTSVTGVRLRGFDRILQGKKVVVADTGPGARERYKEDLQKILVRMTKQELQELCKKDDITYVTKQTTAAEVAEIRAMIAFGPGSEPAARDVHPSWRNDRPRNLVYQRDPDMSALLMELVSERREEKERRKKEADEKEKAEQDKRMAEEEEKTKLEKERKAVEKEQRMKEFIDSAISNKDQGSLSGIELLTKISEDNKKIWVEIENIGRGNLNLDRQKEIEGRLSTLENEKRKTMETKGSPPEPAKGKQKVDGPDGLTIGLMAMEMDNLRRFRDKAEGVLKRICQDITEIKTGRASELQELCKKDDITYVTKQTTVAELAEIRAMIAFGPGNEPAARDVHAVPS
ncbi:hypothetical protein CBR_g39709 [Chara braunii]|uniref:Uncharacterized protein n=1 Tax=Chara braunii TaxID=69332 RepID=A0A388LSG5_CHABU|nr:hypothetical protein CBR_g39709 [Chara braunii]|eukprot:GBG85143.1 hypothetical protein CBR_g39709 [Chara braunii]